MKLLTKPLKLALAETGAAIKSKPPLPILSCVRLRIKDGLLELATTNIDAFLTKLVPCDGELQPLCVPHSTLKQVIEQCGEEVTLEVEVKRESVTRNEFSRLIVKSGVTMARLPTLPWEEFPQGEFGEMKNIAVAAHEIANGIESVAWAADDGNTRHPRYGCILIKLEPAKAYCFGSRGTVSALWECGLICEQKDIVIPSTLAEMLVPVLRDEHSDLRLSENHVQANSLNGTTTVKLFGDEYLRWESIQELFTPIRAAKGIWIQEEVLKKACLLSGVFASERQLDKDLPPMEIEQQNGSLILRGGCENQFEHTESSEAEPCFSRFNSKYLNEALPKLNAKKVRFISTPNGAFFENETSLTIAIGVLPKPPTNTPEEPK